MQYTVGMQYAVCSGVHSTQYAVGTQYTVGAQYAVGISAKRSTHTVALANIIIIIVYFLLLYKKNTTVYVIVCSSSNMYFTSFNKFTINYTSVLTLLQYAYSPRACLI